MVAERAAPVIVLALVLLFCAPAQAGSTASGNSAGNGTLLACVDPNADTHHGTSEPPLLFIFATLVVGSMAKYTLSKFPLPYTVVLLILGMVVGGVIRLGDAQWWYPHL